MSFGTGVFIGNNVTFDIEIGAKLEVGSNVKITGYTVIGGSGRISIGSSTLVAEFVSIRDSDHGVKLGSAITNQPLSVGTVRIGSGAWIARGVAVLRGAEIGDGVVIGANSVVKSQIADQQIALGIPARAVRTRPE
jgi:acetyltransferase-like isoleucine patch superfamily enzyme